MAQNADHTYRIAYDAWIGQHKYQPSFTVQSRFPITRQHAKELAHKSFKPYLDSRRMLRRLRVTGNVRVS